MSVFYQDRGINASQMGVLFALDACVSTFATPFISAVIDKQLAAGKLHARERAIRWSFIVATVTFLLQALVDLDVGLPRFAVFLVCRFVLAVSFSPTVSIITAHTLVALGGDKDRFGEERLYGAYGWMICSLLLGVFMDWTGSWVMYAGTFSVGLVCICLMQNTASTKHHRLPPDGTTSTEPNSPTAARRPAGAENISSWNLIRFYMSKAQSRAFFFSIFCWGVGMSLVETLLFLLFKELGSSNALCGLSVVVTVVFEIPLLKNSKFVLSKFSTRCLFAFGLVCWIIRGVGYTLCPNGWCVVALEPLHGVTFACCHLAAVQYVSMITPVEQTTTGQGVMSSVQSGLGYVFGTFVGGFLIDHFGEKVLYRSVAMLVFIGLVVFLIYTPEEGSSQAASLEAGPARIGKATDESPDEEGDEVPMKDATSIKHTAPVEEKVIEE